MEHTTTTHTYRALSGLLALGLAFAGITIASSAAHAATTTATYVSDIDGVTTNTVDATVIDTSISAFTAGWYVCDSTVIAHPPATVTGKVNIILGDSCDWTSYGLSLQVGTINFPTSLTIWSGVANTGKLNVSGVPAIGVYNDTELIVNGGSISATSLYASAGIGGRTGDAAQLNNGAITVQWRANIDAIGGDYYTIYAAGAGIGGAGSNNAFANGGSEITINTNGLVRATGGTGDGNPSFPLASGANIGSGGTQNGPEGGIATVPTLTVQAPTTGAGGSVQMRDSSYTLVPAAMITNVASGSSVTYVAQPSTGYEVDYVGYSGGMVTDLGNNVYRFTPTALTGQIAANFVFKQIVSTALTLSASPASPQTYPGNVTLSSTFTDAGTPVANIPVVFTVNGAPQAATNTDDQGVATLTLTSPLAGSYDFGASFAGNSEHVAATATPISGYKVLAPQPNFAINAPSTSETVYGHAPVSLTTTGQLSLDQVQWSVPSGNPVATIDAATGVLTILAAGSVQVTAIAPEDSTHAAATATRTITVTPLPVTVTANNLSAQFGDPVTLTWTPNPELIGNDMLTGTLKLAGPTRIGEIAIVQNVAFANPNYTVTFVPGTLTVTPNGAQQAVLDLIRELPDPVLNHDDANEVALATKALFGTLSEIEADALPDADLFALKLAQLEAADVNHTDPLHGVTASSDDLPWQVRLVATPSEKDAPEFREFEGQISSGRDLLALYNVHFVDTLSGDTWQPEAGSTVEISLSQVGLTGFTEIQVQHQLPDGSLETVPSSQHGSVLKFEGASFSLYGVTGLQAEDVPPNGGNGSNVLPRTGSASQGSVVTLALATLIGAALALSVSRRRRA